MERGACHPFSAAGGTLSLTRVCGQTFAIWGAVAAVALLLLVFSAQLMAELRDYGIKLVQGQVKAAKDSFFFSFTGSVVYGHGKPHRISVVTRTTATLLCDALYLYVGGVPLHVIGVVLTASGGRLICVRLLEALACDYTIPSSPRLLADPHIVCWTGRHLYMAAASLVALSFFVPLSIMVAPMLMEAPHGMVVREYPPTLVTHSAA